MKRRIINMVQDYLLKKGILVTKYRSDLDSYFISPKHRQHLIRVTAESLDQFLEAQDVFPTNSGLDTFALVSEFYELYQSNPYKYLPHSSGFNNLLCLYLLMKHLDPELVIESGVFVGQSTWTLRNAVPDAKIESFDLDLSKLRYKDAKVNFHEYDWAEHSFADVNPAKSVCFFDDHVDQVKRTIEAHERKFKYLIFDDNSPVEMLYLSKNFGPPMFDFMYFDGFDKDNEIIEWEMLGEQYSYEVDVSYLEKGRNLIESYRKMPSLYEINGFKSALPLTIARLKDS